MNIKDVTFKKPARDKIVRGIDILADAVASTLGAEGRTVIIEDVSGYPIITKDGVTVAKSIQLEDPLENIGATLIKQAASRTVDSVGDGPQPLYSKVLTPKGFIKIEDLKLGDSICGTNKSIQKVIGVFPKGKKKIYKLKFSNNEEVECSDNHLWSVTTSYGVKKTLTTLELINSGKVKYKQKDGSIQHGFYIPNTIVDFENENKLSLDPYFVGLLLGDGSLGGVGSKRSSIELSLALNQGYLLDKISLPENIKYTVFRDETKHYLRVKFSRIINEGLTMFDYLREIGLFGAKSNTKFIPKQYLYSDYNSRLRLLEGLSATDGHINKRGLLEYSTISENLCNDVVELMKGLGKNIYYYKMKRKKESSYSDTPIYRISELKGYKYGIKLMDIEETEAYTEMMCIKVSNEDSLYITNNYIPTHNTTTSIVLSRAIIKNSMKLIDNGASPIEIKRGIDECSKEIIEKLKEKSIPIDNDKISSVAIISTNNDVALGNLISEAFIKAGDNGLVVMETSENEETYIDYVDGMNLGRGYESSFFITDEAKQRAVLQNPLILILDVKIDRLDEILRFIEVSIKNNKPLLIVGELDDKIIKILAQNKVTNNVKVCVVKPAMFGERKREMLQDLAIATGGIMISDETGDNIDIVDFNALGNSTKAVVTSDDTILILDREKHKEAIDSRIESLKERLRVSESEVEKKLVKERISKLSGGVSVIKVGASSEVELKEKKDRVDDAIHAVKASIQEGIVAGGGVALFDISKTIKKEGVGNIVLIEAIKEPFRQILKNGGVSDKDILNHEEEIMGDIGVNVKTMEYCDMFIEGIIDPVKVTRKALENAVSVAGTILLTDTVVSIAREK